MLLETFYVGRRQAYRSVAAAARHEPADEIIQIDAPAGANRLWRLDSRCDLRPYVTADWVIAWKLATADARRIQPLEVVG
jgi:hypothetical protein